MPDKEVTEKSEVDEYHLELVYYTMADEQTHSSELSTV